MPLPLPSPSQEHDDFIGACMAASVMRDEFPKQAQRYAVCESQWRRAKKKGTSKAIEWSETAAEIERTGRITTEDTIRLIGPPGV